MNKTTICFTLTKEEKKQLEELAKKSHLSISAFIRIRCFGTRI